MGGIGEGREAVFEDDKYLQALSSASELGVDFFDTAEAYSDGRSERIIGTWLTGKNRDLLRIATKISPENLVRERCIRHLDASLDRLQTEYVDLYQVHWPNPKMSDSEVAESLLKIFETGKVRALGLCNHPPMQILRIQSLVPDLPIVSNQVEVSIFDSYQVSRSVSWCNARDMFTFAYSPLGKGRINAPGRVSEALRNIASKIGMTPAQLALSWVSSLGLVVPVVASRTPGHLEENALFSSFDVPTEVMNELSKIAMGSVAMVPAGKIRVSPEGDGGRMTYTTLAQALDNDLGFFPSPSDLAIEVSEDADIKPVKVVRESDGLLLVEGRMRYWGWIIAFGPDCPIPTIEVQSPVP